LHLTLWLSPLLGRSRVKREGYGAGVPERWFLFVQLEIPWELGPADGRYLLRGGAEREPEHVVVLRTVGAARRRERGLPAGRARRGREVKPEPEPTAVPVTHATVIDPVSVSAQAQAQAWLAELDGEREAWAAAGVLNRVLLAHRVAAADPYTHELSPAQALTVRAGWGVGEQVADGQWEFARELGWSGSLPRRRRAAALRPLERLAWLLGGREQALLCEELTLRARRDLDHGRVGHATVELRGAYAAALAELSAEGRQDLALRIAELRELSGTVAGGGSFADSPAPHTGEPDEQSVRHALERLESALRARSAGLKLE
jgi:hypothetical protein